jgi:hypothetical protein
MGAEFGVVFTIFNHKDHKVLIKEHRGVDSEELNLEEVAEKE